MPKDGGGEKVGRGGRIRIKAELSQHLGYSKGEQKPEHQTNQPNGATAKRVLNKFRVLTGQAEQPRAPR